MYMGQGVGEEHWLKKTNNQSNLWRSGYVRRRLRFYAHMKSMTKERLNWQIWNKMINLKNIRWHPEQKKVEVEKRASREEDCQDNEKFSRMVDGRKVPVAEKRGKSGGKKSQEVIKCGP